EDRCAARAADRDHLAGPRRRRLTHPASSRPRRSCRPGGVIAPSQPQRPTSALSTAMAAGPAVEERSTSGPSSTERAPASRSCASSSGSIPPSGPTITTISSRPSSLAERSCSARLMSPTDSCSCSTSTEAPSAVRSRSCESSCAVLAGSPTSGMPGRRHCLTAARAVAAHLARPLRSFSPRQTDTERRAIHGTTASTPSSVADSTACSSRPPVARACTRVRRGRRCTAGDGSVSSRRSSVSLRAAVTSASTWRPGASVSSTCSPTPIRATFAAWRPSSPSSTSASPATAVARESSRIRNPGGVVGIGCSPVGSEVAQALAQLRERTALALGAPRGLVPAQGGELLQQLPLLFGERGGDVHVEHHADVAAPLTPQRRDAQALQGDLLTGLRAGTDVQLLLAVEGVQGDGRAEGGRGHGHRDGGHQVVAVAVEHLVVRDGELDEEVARGAARLTGLALAAQLDAGAVLDAGGDAHGDGALGGGAA